jgi:hypothetical protein
MLNFDEDIKKDVMPLGNILISIFDYVGTASYFKKHIAEILRTQIYGAGLHSRSENKSRVIVCHNRSRYAG